MFFKKAKQIKRLQEKVSYYEKEYKELEQKYFEAKNLKDILKSLTEKTREFEISGAAFVSAGDIADMIDSNIPDDVPRYVDDLFGGKVIKQEANKAILIKEDGTVKEGVTRGTCDKGRTYKLIQE